MNTQEASVIIDGAISKIDLLIAQNQRLAEALEFYASGIGHTEIEDGGLVAREALEKRTPKP